MNTLIEQLRRIDQMAFDKAKKINPVLPTIVKPCLMKLYVIKFSDGRKNHSFSAMNDEEALSFVMDILSINGELNIHKFDKKHGQAVFCGERMIHIPKHKRKVK